MSNVFNNKESKVLLLNLQLLEVLGKGKVNEALILQQIDYWTTINKKKNELFIDNEYWLFSSVNQMFERDFKFCFGVDTLKRALVKLEKDGYIITQKHKNGKLYRVNYQKIDEAYNLKLDKNMVLIVGDRHSIIEYAISSGVKLIILSSDSDMHESHIEEAKEQGVNVIRTPYDTYHIAKLVSLANYVKTIIKICNPITFLNTDYVDDVLEKNEKLRHTNYPIVDKNNKCLGLLKITDLNDRVPKKVILVDHNEKAQSVDGIEEAEIKEIIDHHNLGSITTTSPINFRNVVLGSTCTIVYTLFKERGIGIPKRIAGALITGILSDTLILSSPTATDIDRQAVTDLARIAEVDYEVYGMSLIKAGTSMEGMTKEDVIYNDFKAFTINGKTFAIGQFFTTDFSEIEKDIPEYVKALDKVAENNNYQLVCLYFTDIIKKGSYVLYNTFGKNYIELAYNESNLLEGTYIENCVSRKKHMVPIIMEVME